MRRLQSFNRLCNLGLSFAEIESLARIERTLHRWSELECGDGDSHIERDEQTGIPYRYRECRFLASGDPRCRTRVPDRERGALRRLSAILAGHPGLVFYHQTDPRGCALYIIPADSIGDRDLDSCYSSLGVAVC